MKKYRILKYYNFDKQEWFYQPQVKNHFLFIGYWTSVGKYAYSLKNEAMKQIENAGKPNNNYADSIVFEIEK